MVLVLSFSVAKVCNNVPDTVVEAKIFIVAKVNPLIESEDIGPVRPALVVELVDGVS